MRGSAFEGIYMTVNRDQYATFEEYCKERWDLKRNYANKLIASASVVENLGTIVPIQPANEAQVRPLTKLDRLHFAGGRLVGARVRI